MCSSQMFSCTSASALLEGYALEKWLDEGPTVQMIIDYAISCLLMFDSLGHHEVSQDCPISFVA